MKLQKIFFLGVGLGLTLAFSCKKVDELKDLAGGWTAATDAVQSMSSLSDLYSQTSQIGDSELRSGDCFSTTVTRGTNQSTAIIDFDNGTCTSSVRPRSGQINVTLTGASYTVTNAVLTATTSNYVVNGYRLSGTQTITNLGRNSSQQLQYRVEKNFNITRPGSTTAIPYTENVTVTWTAGEDTPLVPENDEFTIAGSGSGTDSNGNGYTLTIVNPLLVKRSCTGRQSKVVSGILDVTPSGYSARRVDFGNGTCDQTINVSVGTYNTNISW